MQLHSLLTSILDRGERLTACLSHLTPGKEPLNPLNRKVGGPQSWSGCFGRREKYVDLTGFQNWDHPACSAVAVLTVLLWLWNEGDEDKTGTEERRKE